MCTPWKSAAPGNPCRKVLQQYEETPPAEAIMTTRGSQLPMSYSGGAVAGCALANIFVHHHLHLRSTRSDLDQRPCMACGPYPTSREQSVFSFFKRGSGGRVCERHGTAAPSRHLFANHGRYLSRQCCLYACSAVCCCTFQQTTQGPHRVLLLCTASVYFPHVQHAHKKFARLASFSFFSCLLSTQ